MIPCAFCGRDPHEYVDVGVGSVPVAITCCDLGCAAWDHRWSDDAEIRISSKELREIGERLAQLRPAQDLIANLSAALTDEGPTWSFDGLADLRRRVVYALPGDDRVDWLKPYVDPEGEAA